MKGVLAEARPWQPGRVFGILPRRHPRSLPPHTPIQLRMGRSTTAVSSPSSPSPPDSLEALTEVSRGRVPTSRDDKSGQFAGGELHVRYETYLGRDRRLLGLGLRCLACGSTLALDAIPPWRAERHSRALGISPHPSAETVAWAPFFIYLDKHMLCGVY